MKAKKLIKKHRISNGYDWKAATTKHKIIYYGNVVDPDQEVDTGAESFSAASGNVLVIIDGAGPIEMNAEMVGYLIEYGVFKVVGKSPFDIEFGPFILDI